MKRPTMLVQALLHQAERDLDLSVERDVELVRRRCEHEGLSFLTITLPQLSDALERGLEAGSFTCPTSFSRHGSLPRFMGGFFKRVFTMDGRLLPEPCPDVIFYIRQVCRFFKKLKLECSDKRNLKAVQHFKEVEGDLRRMTPLIEREDDVLDKISGIIWSQVFPETDNLDFVCHHGPGVTADRLYSNQRYRILQWNQRSEYTFPSDLHCYPNYWIAAQVSGIEGMSGSESGVEYLDIKEEIPVRVVFVPKTQTAPRVIAIEPSHMQYMQQSIKDYVYKVIETHRLTKDSIRFSDQSVNQRLAYRASIDKRLATLDLKDASDRVHLHLVQRIFKTSGLLPFLEDARSLHATLPDDSNMILFKYASMGSALCFPVEAMVFFTLIQAYMHRHDGICPSSRSIRKYSRKIDVYGDDIIVPVEYADGVVEYLESYALKVNVSKSFKNSFFRESCGADYYNGVPVNPVYARKVPHDNLRQWGPEEIISWNATADLFYLRGMWLIAQEIRDLLRRVVRRTIPRTREFGSGLAHYSFLFSTHCSWNKELQGWKQKRLHYDPIKRKDSIDGDDQACLNKWGIEEFISAQSHVRSDRYSVGPRRIYSRPENISGDRNGQCGVRLSISHIDARFSDGCLSYIFSSLAHERAFSSLIRPVAKVGDRSVDGPTRVDGDLYGSAHWLNPKVLSDPLLFLIGRAEGKDFHSSTKRGCFKSKSRWVSLTS